MENYASAQDPKVSQWKNLISKVTFPNRSPGQPFHSPSMLTHNGADHSLYHHKVSSRTGVGKLGARVEGRTGK